MASSSRSSSSSTYRPHNGRVALPAIITSRRREIHERDPRWWLVSVLTAAALCSAPVMTTACSGTTVSNDTHITSSNYPSLDLVQSILFTTAPEDFAGHSGAYTATHDWQQQRLLNTVSTSNAAPYLVCADYGQALDARAGLEQEFGSSSVHTISHSAAHGACFVATAAPSAAEAMLRDPSHFGVTTAGPFPSVLKISPGVLDHGDTHVSALRGSDGEDKSKKKLTGQDQALVTRHGDTITLGGVRGLTVKLSPGTVTAHQSGGVELVQDWRSGLMSR